MALQNAWNEAVGPGLVISDPINKASAVSESINQLTQQDSVSLTPEKVLITWPLKTHSLFLKLAHESGPSNEHSEMN